MKRFILLLSLIEVFMFSVSSKEYLPIVREGVEWGNCRQYGYADNGNVSYIFFRNQFKGDSIVEGKTYKKCYQYSGKELNPATDEVVSLMREENGKVYVKPVSDYDCSEYLAYDYESIYANAEKTEEIEIDGQKRRLISNETSRNRLFIEGLGGIDDFDGQTIFSLPLHEPCGCMWSEYITYEKKVGGDIVYKTAFFNPSDPALAGRDAVIADGAGCGRVQGTVGAAIVDGGDGGESYAIFRTDGSVAAAGVAEGRTTIPLPAGIYVASVGGKARRIAVR